MSEKLEFIVEANHPLYEGWVLIATFLNDFDAEAFTEEKLNQPYQSLNFRINGKETA